MNSCARLRRGAAIVALSIFFAGAAFAQGQEEGPRTAPGTTPGTASGTGPSSSSLSTRPIATESRSDEPSLTGSGSTTPTPVVDGDIENVPNLTDLELAVARITASAQRAQANLSIAPLLIPGHYRSVASELRLGVSADSDGAFGLGAALGYNQARVRLEEYATDPAFCEPKATPGDSDEQIAALDAEIEATLGDLCGLVATACEGAKDTPCKDAARECAMAGPAAPGSPRIPPVLLLLKVIKRAEVLRDSSSPPTPPRIGDRSIKDAADPIAELNAYVVAATAYQARRAAFTSIRVSLPAARELRARREKAGEQAVLSRERRLVGERQLCRLEAAYRRASLITVGGSVSFFPLYLGPRIEESDSEGNAHLANAHYLRRVDAVIAYRFYATRRASAQLRGGFRAERGDASEESLLLWRALAGADLGFFVPIDPTANAVGFQRGIGVGLSGTAWFCGSEGGCFTEIGLSNPYVGASGLLPLSRRIQLNAFVEWRQSVALQIRAGVEGRIDSVVGPLPNTNPSTATSPVLTRIIPTLAVGSSFWGL